MATRQPRSTAKGSTSRGKTQEETADSIASDLSYAEARTALDLALAQLQAKPVPICFTLAGACEKLQDFCPGYDVTFGCTYAVFSTTKFCPKNVARLV